MITKKVDSLLLNSLFSYQGIRIVVYYSNPMVRLETKSRQPRKGFYVPVFTAYFPEGFRQPREHAGAQYFVMVCMSPLSRACSFTSESA